eukprot:TRINITY_DN20222_c0_g1_i1.p1 TRINITY_DN20222_c0_g1~~TRINITY_DN20222_c0_g1_i1.p1  ORF type:complete len:607 (+),score=213.86 TRINITY_DN20222_c0_g1_i1:29-1822(+)
MASRSGSRSVPAALRQEQAGRAIDAASGLHARKVSSLLNSQNRLQCENAALKREEVARRQSSHGRGAAFARAEAELLKQDAMLRALYDFLGKEVARPQILRALKAGPKRLSVTTREEIRWRIEDTKEQVDAAQKELQALKEAAPVQSAAAPAETGAGGQKRQPLETGDTKILALKVQIEDWKERIARLEEENATHQVEVASLERALERGLERLDGPSRAAAALPPWQLLPGAQGAGKDLEELRQKARAAEKEFGELHRSRVELERKLLDEEEKTKTLQKQLDEARQELDSKRKQREAAQRNAGVVHQAEFLKEQRMLKAREEELEKIQSQRKAMRGDMKGSELDGRRQISAMHEDLQRQSQAGMAKLKSEIAAEEKALAAENEAELEDLAKAESRAEADCELSRREKAQLLKEISECREAAAADRNTVRQAVSRQEAQAAEAAEMRKALEEALAAKVQIQDARIDLEVGLERAQRCLADETLNRKRQTETPQKHQLARLQPEVREVDLVCLKSELAAQKDATAKAVAALRQEVAVEEAALRVAEESAVEHRAAATDRAEALAELQKFEHSRRCKQEAIEAKRNAAADLAAAKAEDDR